MLRENMSAMGDSNTSVYRLQPGRGQNQGHDLTPHSAVSSFNLPAAYDVNLITPVSMTSSPNMPAKTGTAISRETELSPLHLVSPTSYQLGWEGDAYSPAYLQQSMKPKDRSGPLQISTTDPFLPPSPSYVMAPNIYYGNYGVSTPASARTTDSSPSMHQSPHHHQQQSPHMSAGGMSNGSHHSMSHPSPNGSLFRQTNPAPILIAPNPLNRRVSTTIRQEYGTSRHNSTSSARSPPHSQAPPQGAFPEPLSSQPSRGKKSHKRKDHHANEYYDELVSTGDLNDGEQLLMDLTRSSMQWKEVAAKWNQQMNQSKTVAALQMRKKRLLERLRVWTPEEERAMADSLEDYDKVKADLKWEFVKETMVKHGSRETWSRHDIEKHYREVHGADQDFEVPPRKRSRSSSGSHSSWSEGHVSPTHQTLDNGDTANLLSALSTASMDEVRARANSDASARFMMRRAQRQVQEAQQVQHAQQQESQRQANAAMFQQHLQQNQQHHHSQHNQHNPHNQQQHNWGPGS